MGHGRHRTVAHHHADELAPTAAEPHTWYTKATELATLLPAHSTVAAGNTSYRPVTTQISKSTIQNEFGFLLRPQIVVLRGEQVIAGVPPLWSAGLATSQGPVPATPWAR